MRKTILKKIEPLNQKRDEFPAVCLMDQNGLERIRFVLGLIDSKIFHESYIDVSDRRWR